MRLLRHLLAILLLPFTVTVIVPWWLGRATSAAARAPEPSLALRVVLVVAGTLIGAVGIALFIWCVSLFARVGRGTLAPWDPTQRLVVVGPYRHVRNPMISAVACVLVAEALVLASSRLAVWALIFVAINHAYFLAVEEPGLVRRFGDAYGVYRQAVPRWIPRWRPWRGEIASG